MYFKFYSYLRPHNLFFAQDGLPSNQVVFYIVKIKMFLYRTEYGVKKISANWSLTLHFIHSPLDLFFPKERKEESSALIIFLVRSQ